jgi:DNA-binding CsgD family transcriptional regulator/tetratricopeptide (TPR) repeat protein
LEEVVCELGDEEPRLRGLLYAEIADACWVGRDVQRSVAASRRAIELGQQTRDERLSTHANFSLALAQWQSLNLTPALDGFQQTLVHARAAGDPWLEGWPLFRLPLVLHQLGRTPEAVERAEDGLRLLRRTLDWGEGSYALAALATVAVSVGDLPAAEAYIDQVLVMVQRSRYGWGGALALPALACGQMQAGAWDAAGHALDLFVEPGRLFDQPGPILLAGSWIFRLLIQAHKGDLDAVRAEIAVHPQRLAALRRPDMFSLAMLCAVVEIADCLQRPDLVGHLYQPLAEVAERGVVFACVWPFLLPRVLGIAANLLDRPVEAAAHFERAIEFAAAAGATAELGRSCLDYARLLINRPGNARDERALGLLYRAQSVFRELKMPPFLERAAALVAAISSATSTTSARAPIVASTGPALNGPAAVLSRREIEVLRLMALGRSNREISDELSISVNTVFHHVGNIFNKTGTTNRTEAASYAHRHGLAG